MIPHLKSGNDLAIDTKSLNDLKTAAKQNSPEAAHEAAKQFETVFMDMMIKSMREATPQDGAMDNDQTRMFTSMLDQQLSQSLAKRNLGLADMIEKQLAQTVGGLGGKVDALKETPAGSVAPTGNAGKTSGKSAASIRHASNVSAFKEKLAAHAEQASRLTGIPAKFMLGQAALETGWGKHEIRATDGSNSHNVFAIKANSSWKGKVVVAPTTEYINGVAHTKLERFRSYNSYAEAFTDYANMLKNNPRYQHVMTVAQDATSFAHGLQRAGYATDPHYAAKLSHIIKNALV